LSSDVSFAEMIVPPGRYLVAGGSRSGADVEIAGLAMGNASSSGDAVVLEDCAGRRVDTVVYGPDFFSDTNGDVVTSPGEIASTLSVEVENLNSLGTVISTLPYAFDRSFTDENNETGSGQLTLANDDTAGLAAADLDRMITFKVQGTKAWSMIVESKTRVTFRAGEEFDQITALTGRGHLSLFENAVLYPSRGVDVSPIEEDRTFNWSTPSPVYDDSSWGRAKAIMTVAQAQSGGLDSWTAGIGIFAEGWPDPSTRIIWAHSGTSMDAPEGFCYFRKDITVGADGFYVLLAAADNRGELYIDGQKVISLGGFYGAYTYNVYITAGQHTIAVVVENHVWSGTRNPAGLIFALYTATATGEPGTLLAHSDSTWKIVAYPDHPPGMYVGKVLHVVQNEAIARGVWLFDQINLMFTETVDSAGAPWPETLDIASKVGTTYLVFLIEQAVTYIDMWMKPGTLDLYAWNKGTRQRNTGITLHGPTDEDDPYSGNIFEQGHTIL